MKLLGRLHLGPKRPDRSDDRTNNASSNANGHHTPIHSSSPFRRKKRDKTRGPTPSTAAPTPALPPNLPWYEGTSANSVLSIPTNHGYDDNTLDANTLFEWSLADNAPSIGSAADLFAERKPCKVKGGGYESSSDEDDDDDDVNDENTQHFQYCKLSDSPPPKSGSIDEDQTPVRKGRGLFARSSSTMNSRSKPSHTTTTTTTSNPAYRTPDRLKSPSRIKAKTQRGKHSPLAALPLQTLRRDNSGPVDVDSFIDEDEASECQKNNNTVPTIRRSSRTSNSSNNSAKSPCREKQLPAELKGRIHAMNFDEEDNDNLNSSNETNQTGDNSSYFDSNASVKNVGNANSPKKSTRLIDPTTFCSTRNIGDMNSPMRMIQKELADQEPEFTFSISEEDLFGSDADSLGATTWLLNEGCEGGTNDLLLEKSKWELDNLQSDIQRDERSIAAVAGEDENVAAAATGSGSAGAKKFRKKVKDQMKNKFNAMVSKKKAKANSKGPVQSAKKEHTSANKKINNNPISHRSDRLKLDRDQSGLSITPLTGLEEHSRMRILKARKNKELQQEVERRKERERQDIEKHQQDAQQRLLLEKERRLRQREALKWRAAGGNTSNFCSNDAVASGMPESLERLENRKKLEQWMMGEIQYEEHEAQKQNHQNDAEENQSQQESPSRYLPSLYEGNPPLKNTRSLCTVTTNRVDNTTMRRQSLQKDTFDFDAEFPDEDSTAQTPEASAPATHDFSCVLCRTSERTHLAAPCMHFSFCAECVTKMEQKGISTGVMTCSVCKEKVTKFSKVFY